MPQLHFRHSWTLDHTPGGQPLRRCVKCGKTRAWVDQRAINEAKGRFNGDTRDGFGGSGAMGG